MANHKYRRRRVSRAGCHMCKPWKIWGNAKGRRPARELRQAGKGIE